MNTLLEIAVIINDRYRIVRQLGQGGLSRTYLVEDTHRFDELCVLKEFAPQNQNLEINHKAEELFEREAKILYNLKHPQIPQFRAIFRSLPQGLFLVQDYIEGQTYQELLNLRLKEGKTFNEAEMRDLMEKILPVLDYLHSEAIIHRDIAPDNLIYCYLAQLPILIDFGSVKQISLETSQNGHYKTPFTQLGKKGYSPDEQIEEGIIFPNSDLYALAVTILVLLTGKEPSLLKDDEQWKFPEEAILSAKFKQILTKMLSKQPSDRFNSAQEVLTSLKKADVQFLEAQPTIIVAPALPTPTPETIILTPNPKSNPILGCFGKILLVLTIILGSGLLGWIGGKLWLKQVLSVDLSETPQQVFTPSPSPQNNPLDPESQRQEAIRTRCQQLGIDHQFFQKLVDQVFLSQYPQQTENTFEDAQWQEKRDLVAQKLLDQLSSLSDEARQGLGSYDQQQRNAWKQEVNQLHLSSRALYDLADAAFLKEFPEQENEPYSEQPIGQVWSAFVLDTLKTLQSGKAYEEISLSETTQRQGTLEPGQGQVYVVRLPEGQILELKLEADQDTFLSVYSPTGNNNLLEDSTIAQWYGILPESGYYELIIVSKGEKTLNYQLNLQIVPSE